MNLVLCQDGTWSLNARVPLVVPPIGRPFVISGKRVLVFTDGTALPGIRRENLGDFSDAVISLRRDCDGCMINHDYDLESVANRSVRSLPFFGDRYLGTVMITDIPVNHRIHFFDFEKKEWGVLSFDDWPILRQPQLAMCGSKIALSDIDSDSIYVVDLEARSLKMIGIPFERRKRFFAMDEETVYIANGDRILSTTPMDEHVAAPLTTRYGPFFAIGSDLIAVGEKDIVIDMRRRATFARLSLPPEVIGMSIISTWVSAPDH